MSPQASGYVKKLETLIEVTGRLRDRFADPETVGHARHSVEPLASRIRSTTFSDREHQIRVKIDSTLDDCIESAGDCDRAGDESCKSDLGYVRGMLARLAREHLQAQQ